ncbi:MAG: hypothetical protein Q8R28_11130 [Dehalococcoidia bacterium]|nr:hypothetical protein [Dehalococcoidia bacterium]
MTIDFFECLYCEATSADFTGLLDHVRQEHLLTPAGIRPTPPATCNYECGELHIPRDVTLRPYHYNGERAV